MSDLEEKAPPAPEEGGEAANPPDLAGLDGESHFIANPLDEDEEDGDETNAHLPGHKLQAKWDQMVSSW